LNRGCLEEVAEYEVVFLILSSNKKVHYVHCFSFANNLIDKKKPQLSFLFKEKNNSIKIVAKTI